MKQCFEDLVAVSPGRIMRFIVHLEPTLADLSLNTLRSIVGRFMERYNLVLRVPNKLKFTDEQLQDLLEDFEEELLDTMTKYTIWPSEVWNMDQVGV